MLYDRFQLIQADNVVVSDDAMTANTRLYKIYHVLNTCTCVVYFK